MTQWQAPRRTRPTQNCLCRSMLAAVDGAEVLLVLTDWPEFAEADPVALGRAVAHRAVIDGRCLLDPGRWRAAGWHYHALGRAARNGGPAAATTAA